ncbi:hypothetical protein TGPRC2_425320 [Toxoplasma gondii TgCatPRC2]|uniref:RNA recognition motif-containing protein n=2 Tax=Toxoplasma gondii TaxID=5811 RepID=A0A151HBZ2_TOXGO|nr:splicing factor SF2 [Toxoplasma gondii ARI]KYK66869.1 hypothetical protein TGPRC2_425320 [Toxoplasma gondii TgCatPRC2]
MSRHSPSPRRRRSPSPRQGSRIFVANLPLDVTENELEDLFYKVRTGVKGQAWKSRGLDTQRDAERKTRRRREEPREAQRAAERGAKREGEARAFCVNADTSP